MQIITRWARKELKGPDLHLYRGVHAYADIYNYAVRNSFYVWS